MKAYGCDRGKTHLGGNTKISISMLPTALIDRGLLYNLNENDCNIFTFIAFNLCCKYFKI